MKNTTKRNAITRLEFLNYSGLIAAGITFLPGFVRAYPPDEKDDHAVAAVMAGYQIIVSSRANAVEKEAAQQLQRYLSKMVGYPIPVVAENQFQGNKAILIGNTHYATAHNVDVAAIPGDGYAYKSAGKTLIISGHCHPVER